MNWPAIVQLLLPLGVVALEQLAGKVKNPQFLAAIREAIAILTALESGQPPPAPAAIPAPRRYARGLSPTPRHRLAAAYPWRPTLDQIRATPPSFLTLPSQLYMLGNDRFGNCVSAEEGASKMAFSIWGQVGAAPAITITDQTCIDWARAHGALNGADLEPIIESMQSDGMQATNGKAYRDGPPASVDYTSDTALRAAIVQGPVKIGIAANHVEHAVNSTNGRTGWLLTNAGRDHNEDHCVALWGFGTIAELVRLFAAAGVNVNVPGGTDTSTLAYALYTWQTVGIIDQPSLLAITGEAWLRNPTTPGVTPTPVPAPTPVPTPVPTPTPTPDPIPPAPPVVGWSGSFIVESGLFGGKHTVRATNGVITSVS